MKIIKTLDDLRKLDGAMELGLQAHLEEYLLALREALEPETELGQFSLARHGYIVILEQEDDVRDLREVGLNPGDQGLLGCCPEWVEQVALADGRIIYRVGVMYDNDYVMIFYSWLGQFDEEVEGWLADQRS